MEGLSKWEDHLDGGITDHSTWNLGKLMNSLDIDVPILEFLGKIPPESAALF